jgi:hypothetical protein
MHDLAYLRDFRNPEMQIQSCPQGMMPLKMRHVRASADLVWTGRSQIALRHSKKVMLTIAKPKFCGVLKI